MRIRSSKRKIFSSRRRPRWTWGFLVFIVAAGVTTGLYFLQNFKWSSDFVFSPNPTATGSIESIVSQATQGATTPAPEATTTSTKATSTATNLPAPATSTIIRPPSYTPPPVTDTPTATVATTPVPVNYHLIYLRQDQLLHWDTESEQPTVLAESILDFSVESGGRKVLWLRAATGGLPYQLELLDLVTNTRRLLLQVENRPYHISLSPNGNYFAYIAGTDGGQVSMLSISNPEKPKIIGECLAQSTNGCEELIWEKDSRSLVWSDKRGIWLVKPDEDTARLVLNNLFTATDPRGSKSQILVAYQKLSWSPQGRYLLAVSGPPDSDTRWLTMIDTRLGRQVQIADTLGYTSPAASGTWMGDGRLAIIYQDPVQDATPSLLEIWQVTSTSDPFIQPINSINLSERLILDLPPGQYPLVWVAQQDNDSLVFTLSQANTPNLLFYNIYFPTQRLEKKLVYEITSTFFVPAPGNEALVIVQDSITSIYLPQIFTGVIPLEIPQSDQVNDYAWVSEFSSYSPP